MEVVLRTEHPGRGYSGRLGNSSNDITSCAPKHLAAQRLL